MAVTDIKDIFSNELKKAGYEIEYDHGVPVVCIGNAADLHTVSLKVDAIAKKVGYDASRGVKVKADIRNPLSVDDDGQIAFV